MSFDKTKTSLFIITIILLVISLFLSVFLLKQTKQNHKLDDRLKIAQEQLQQTKEKQGNNQSEDEKLIKEFYKTVYSYNKSQKEISMITVKQLATDNIYKDLQNEINVNSSYSPQQNVIHKSSINENDIKILTFKGSGNSQQYLVTTPIYQVFNGKKNDFELNQLVQVENQKITKRVTIQLGE